MRKMMKDTQLKWRNNTEIPNAYEDILITTDKIGQLSRTSLYVGHIDKSEVFHPTYDIGTIQLNLNDIKQWAYVQEDTKLEIANALFNSDTMKFLKRCLMETLAITTVMLILFVGGWMIVTGLEENSWILGSFGLSFVVFSGVISFKAMARIFGDLD